MKVAIVALILKSLFIPNLIEIEVFCLFSVEAVESGVVVIEDDEPMEMIVPSGYDKDGHPLDGPKITKNPEVGGAPFEL